MSATREVTIREDIENDRDGDVKGERARARRTRRGDLILLPVTTGCLGVNGWSPNGAVCRERALTHLLTSCSFALARQRFRHFGQACGDGDAIGLHHRRATCSRSGEVITAGVDGSEAVFSKPAGVLQS